MLIVAVLIILINLIILILTIALELLNHVPI